jgi:hypothetical protein
MSPVCKKDRLMTPLSGNNCLPADSIRAGIHSKPLKSHNDKNGIEIACLSLACPVCEATGIFIVAYRHG